MNQRLTIILIGMAIIAFGLPAAGDVFWRWRSGSGRAVFGATPDWQCVYRSAIRINGGQGRLEILNCADSLRDVMARVKNAFPAQPETAFRQGEAGGWGLIQDGDTVIRLLALNLGALSQTTLFVLTQSAAEYEQSLKPPTAHLLEDAPAYPGSIAQTFVADEEGSAQLEISSAPGQPEPIRTFFNESFVQYGYHAIYATAEHAAGGSELAIFQKGPDLCCVLVQESPQNNNSTITVLHKRLKID